MKSFLKEYSNTLTYVINKKGGINEEGGRICLFITIFDFRGDGGSKIEYQVVRNAPFEKISLNFATTGLEHTREERKN